MRTRLGLAACFLGAFVVGCSSTNPSPALTISPSGTVQVTGPTEFTAQLTNDTDAVAWTITGSGTLSSTGGFHIIYTPPPGSASATLTATAGGLTASVQITSAPAAITGATIPGLSAPVTVQSDAEDIPHIKCAAMDDCLAVQGYVQARDRLFQMDLFRHIARGHLAELIGPDGLSQDVQLRTFMTTRAGHRVEDDLVASMDATFKAHLTAYAAGVNAYLAQLRADPNARLPGEYAQLPFPLTPSDVADWTPQDTMAIARLQQFQLSETLSSESANGQFAAVYAQGALKDLGKLNAWIRAAAPTTEQAHTLAPTPFQGAAPAEAPVRAPTANLADWQDALAETAARTAEVRDRLRAADGSTGSNNWVVAAAKSTAHVSMVANDPHLSLEYPPLFHLVTMTSSNAADDLDIAGGSFAGIPGALVGRGAHVGWGVTVVGYDVTDLYLEQFLPQGACPSAAPCVLFKGAPTATIPAPQTYKVRVAAGAAGLVDAATLGLKNPPPPFVLVVPQHGPIVQAPDAAGKGVSFRWTGQEGNTPDIKAFLGLATATDVDSAMTALTNYTTGAQNFVIADDQGHIAYDPHALVPVRRFADVRVVGGNVIPPWFPLPGDGSAEWGDGTSDCASATLTPVPASCWISDAELPHGKDPAKGYYFTANADPTSPSVSDDNNPLAHPPYLSFDWDDSSGFRATRIDQLLAAAIAKNGSVSEGDMEAIQSDHVSRPGKVFTDYIATITPGAQSPPELAAAQAVLAQWATNGWDCPSGLTGIDPSTSPIDPTATVVQDSSGCFLFHEFLRVLLTNVFTDDLAVARQGVNGLAAIKGMIYMLSLDPNGAGTPAATTFCNDVNAQGQVVAAHTCGAQVVIALVTAYDTLVAHVGAQPSDWVWGRVHTITPESQLAPLVSNGFAPGPYARPGGAFTVDVGTPALSGSGLDFHYTSGGNVRHISLMDPAKAAVKMQLPGPERDGPALFALPDLLVQWVENQYFDFAFGGQSDGVAVSTQTFSP